MMLGDVMIAAFASLLGLGNAMCVLYRTRRLGHGWTGSVLTTIVATGAFAALLTMALFLSGRWAGSLGKDEEAVNVLRGLFATGMTFYFAWALRRVYHRWWPTKEERDAFERGERPVFRW